ncbi:MAG: vitamin B12 dependent-methionine synthase activation domain-containing protein [Stellaceae bacterium]
MTKILLVRHGHVEKISPERFRGRALPPLTAEGWRASEAAREWFADNRYQDLHDLSVEMAEALAEYVHKRIRGELGFAAEEARDPARRDAGARLPRQPLLLRLSQQQLLALLRAEEIGITLSEEDQLDPEQSTSAIVLHHPQAKYFSV